MFNAANSLTLRGGSPSSLLTPRRGMLVPTLTSVCSSSYPLRVLPFLPFPPRPGHPSSGLAFPLQLPFSACSDYSSRFATIPVHSRADVRITETATNSRVQAAEPRIRSYGQLSLSLSLSCPLFCFGGFSSFCFQFGCRDWRSGRVWFRLGCLFLLGGLRQSGD